MANFGWCFVFSHTFYTRIANFDDRKAWWLHFFVEHIFKVWLQKYFTVTVQYVGLCHFILYLYPWKFMALAIDWLIWWKSHWNTSQTNLLAFVSFVRLWRKHFQCFYADSAAERVLLWFLSELSRSEGFAPESRNLTRIFDLWPSFSRESANFRNYLLFRVT